MTHYLQPSMIERMRNVDGRTISIVSGFIRRVEAGLYIPSGIVLMCACLLYYFLKKTTWSFNGEKFKIWDYLVPVQMLSFASNTVFIKVKDTRFDNRYVVIKKYKYIFHKLDKTKRALREIQLLSRFNHPDIIQLLDVITPDQDNQNTYNDIYLVMPEMETTLKRIIESEQRLENTHYLFFIYQILRGLKYMHSAHVIHGDLAPEHIMVNGKHCNVKIAGLGVQSYAADERRCYHAPEKLLCGGRRYDDQQVDMWAVGCIFAELMIRRCQFFFESNIFLRVSLIFSIIGSPDYSDIDWITSLDAREWVRGRAFEQGHDLRKIFKNGKPEAIDLMKQMLQYPPKRITVAEALSHPYFATLHNPKSEELYVDLQSEEIYGYTNCANSNENSSSMDEMRRLLYQKAIEFNPQTTIMSISETVKSDKGDKYKYVT